MADSAGADTRDPELEPGQSDGYRFRRSVGFVPATAINVTPMAGIGPFMFIWTVVLAIPLIMSTGVIGLEQYLGYFLANLGHWPMHLVGVGVAAAIVWLAAGPSLTSAGCRRNWPFGPKQIHEAFPQTQQEHQERAVPPDTGRDASWA
jgi:hypothetical protein